MNDILIRFKQVKNNNIYEVKFDSRLDFDENFKHLKRICDINGNNFDIYDANRRVFLAKNVAIKEFNINNFKLLYIF